MTSSVKKIHHNIYNVGTGKNYSIQEIADMIGEDRITIPSRPAEVQETLADISDTIKDLNWAPKHSLEEKINSY